MSGRSSREALGLMNRAAVMIGVRIASTVLTLVYTILITRTATIEGTGQVMFAMSVALIASMAFSLNVESGSIRFLTKYKAAEDLRQAKGFIVFGRMMIVAVTLLTTIFLAANLAISGTLADWPAQWFIVFAICPFLAFNRLQGRHGTALDAVLQSTLPRMLVRPLVFTTILGLAWINGYSLGPGSIMGLFFLSVFIVSGVQFLLLRPHMKFLQNAKADFSNWRPWTTTGLHLAPALVLQENLKNVIITAAAITVAPAQIAFVAVAISVTNFLNFSISAVDVSFGPRFAKCAAENDDAKLAMLTSASTVLKFCGVVAGCTLLIIFAKPILGLFGDEYQDATVVLIIFLSLPLIKAVLGPSIMLLNIHGHSASIFRVSIFGLLLIVILTPLGGFLSGTIGAPIGTMIGYFALHFALYLECRKRTGVDASLTGAFARYRLAGNQAAHG